MNNYRYRNIYSRFSFLCKDTLIFAFLEKISVVAKLNYPAKYISYKIKYFLIKNIQ